MTLKRPAKKNQISVSSGQQQAGLLYQKLVEHMNEGVLVRDSSEKVIYANPKFCEMTGYSLAEILGKTVYGIWDRDSARKVKYINKNYRKKGLSSTYEATLLTKSGHKLPVLVGGSALPGGGTMGIMTDLRELRHKESIYKQLVENMDEAVWMGDPQENTVYANPKFCQLIGYDLDEMIGKPSYYFWDEESAQRVKHVNNHFRKKGLSSSYQGNLLTKSKKKIPVLVHGTSIPNGGTIGIITDLTELRKKEESAKVLATAVRYASDAIIIFDCDGKITLWNKGAKVAFGYKEDQMLGKKIEAIFPDIHFSGHDRTAETLYSLELHGRHKNKKKLVVSATVTPVFNQERTETLFYLLIARDITSQTRFEDELALKSLKVKEAYNQFGVIRRQMDYIYDLLDTARTMNLKTIADFVVSSIIMLTHVDACIMRIFNPEKNTLDMISSFGVGLEWQGKMSIQYEKSLVQQAVEQETYLKILDLTKDPHYQTPNLARQNNLSGLMVIPLRWNNTLLGSLGLYISPENRFDIFDNEFIEKFVKVIEMVMRTVRL